MIAKQITYRELDKFLRQLGFTETASQDRWRAYRHAASGTLIMLADRDGDLTARASELVSLRRHLVERDLIGEDEIDDFLG